ncbi:uncharacterized protein LY89DRAFT_723540 [Mollisia scopiformis]|uniref:Protein-S-isoprenylcysteine O-methyltransferase n=1 Tax=Mollisia scopiformis TaxID=149040 RepID=A0A132BD28_MOLSC|nr:uncharacterized protein LY89DRAFT_723540 [Mollisia scopiformis]KUJ10288.1 hypothetical protein LY89DRAFT_723540 [Mollisia scopiformis]
MDISPQSLSLIAALTITAYLTSLCAKTPNPNPPTPTVKDRIALLTSTSKSSRYALILLWFSHCTLILFPSSRSRSNICLNPDLLNESLFAWSPTSITFVLVIFIAAPIRLLAYKQLGTNFTFRLQRPGRLVRDGLYKYVQHPSYTTLFAVQVASAFFWLRVDGVAACFLPGVLVRIRGVSEVVAMGFTVVMMLGMGVRVRDEEEMLRREFGREWVEWHERTKRFVPGII